MPKFLPDPGWEIYVQGCALLNNFCVQLVGTRWHPMRITRQLCTGYLAIQLAHVRKACDKALTLPVFVHIESPAIFSQITDTLAMLSPSSTPPITTTTNILINSKEL
jgi:hypothetical protein